MGFRRGGTSVLLDLIVAGFILTGAFSTLLPLFFPFRNTSTAWWAGKGRKDALEETLSSPSVSGENCLLKPEFTD